MTCDLSRWGRRLLPGSLSALGIAILLKAGLFQPLEYAGYQALFQLRGAQSWDNRLVLVAIDDDSLAEIGRFPWPRQQYVKLLDLLSQSVSNIVVFDLLFSEPSLDDQQLAEAISDHGQVILAQARNADGSPLKPVSILAQNALGVGHILTQRDSDGIVRQVIPQVKEVPALGVIATQAYSLVHTEVPALQVDASLWLNWIGPMRSVPIYSFTTVIQGKVPPQAFADKIVLVGVTATGIDPLTTPFDRNPPTSSLLLHATLIQNLLRQNTLQPLPISLLLLLFLTGGPLLSWSLSERGWLRQVIAIAGCWAGWCILSVVLFRANVLAPLASPLALFLVTGSVTGVYDRLREEAALRHQIDRIQKNAALKDEFLRTASHELRTPVTNIQTVIALLRIAESKEDWEEYLEILEEECQQEAALITDLLDFQRLGVKQQPTMLETYDLKDWMAEVVAPFTFRAEKNQQHLQVVCDSAELTLDWLSLRRILSELLNNACKYTPSQEVICVTAQVKCSRLELTVSNSGITLPAEELAKIFEPFYRIIEVDYQGQGGTGLGLCIIKRLAEHLGGDVQVVNQANVLTFAVHLPVMLNLQLC